MKAVVTIWKTGNSTVVTVPPTIVRELGLESGVAVEIDIRRSKKNGS